MAKAMKPPKPVEAGPAVVVDAWKKVVDVQMHFNDIEMRIRNFALSVVLASFAAFGFLLNHTINVSAGQLVVNLFVLVPIAGAIAVYLFFFMDYYWYHRLLVGAVKHGLAIEAEYAQQLPFLSITKSIGKESPVKPTGPLYFLSKLLIRDQRYRNEGFLHSDSKIKLFYYTIILCLIVLSVASAVGGGVQISGRQIWQIVTCWF